MPIIDPDQGVPLPAGTDLADNPVAFSNFYTPVLSRQNNRYTTAANRTALHPANIEGEESYLTTDNRKEINDGANWVSLNTRAQFANSVRLTDAAPINNTVVLMTDAVLSVTTVPAGTYQFRLVTLYSSSTTADLNVVVTPTGVVTLFSAGSQGPATAIPGDQGDGIWLSRQVVGTFPCGGAGVAVSLTHRLEGVFTTTTAGALNVQYGQSVADPTNTVIRAGSSMQLWRIL